MRSAFLNHTIRNHDALFKERFLVIPLSINFETRDYALVASSKMDFYGNKVLIYRNETERHTIKLQVNEEGYVLHAFVYYQNQCEKGILQ